MALVNRFAQEQCWQPQGLTGFSSMPQLQARLCPRSAAEIDSSGRNEYNDSTIIVNLRSVSILANRLRDLESVSPA